MELPVLIVVVIAVALILVSTRPGAQKSHRSSDNRTAKAIEPEHPDLLVNRRPEKGERNDGPEVYEYFGTYSNEDARLLLDAFLSGDINYTLDVDKMGIQDMSAFQAANGGTFGAGVGIAIGVHADDCDEAMTITQRVLKIMT